MDFIEKLPFFSSFNTILVIVDHLLKKYGNVVWDILYTPGFHYWNPL